jgi:hypothetical protein
MTTERTICVFSVFPWQTEKPSVLSVSLWRKVSVAKRSQATSRAVAP